jgi:hypothetical protein
VRWKPKLAPEAISIRLLGPGVIDETKENIVKPASSSGLINGLN